MTVYTQDVILTKLNIYLKRKNRSLSLDEGYCHGISLLWLYLMSIGDENWFYSTIRSICDCVHIRDFDAIEADIELFLEYIEWLQNSANYVDTIDQFDIDHLLELPRVSLSYIFNQNQFALTLEMLLKKNRMICISGPTHSIGVFKKEDKYHIYDSNYHEGHDKIFKNTDKLRNEIIERLFLQNYLLEDKLPVIINTISHSVNANDNTIKKCVSSYLIKSTLEINQPTHDGITNLELACESHDIEEVNLLLRNGADPNQQGSNGWKVLCMVCVKGYADLVEILLRSGSDPNESCHQRSALCFAVEKGHETIVNTLLKFGANSLDFELPQETAINVAQQKQRWSMVVSMLLHIDHAENINDMDLNSLRKHQKEIMVEVKQRWNKFSRKEKQHLRKILYDLYYIDCKFGYFASRIMPQCKKSVHSMHTFFAHKKYEQLHLNNENNVSVKKVRFTV